MRTPIADFISDYVAGDTTRFHMPGHKGKHFVGIESHDITEIKGADVLDSAAGIIAESERCATELFSSARTVYSTEGSTLAIRTMLFLATSGSRGSRPLVIAGRNAHKSFIYSAALLNFDIQWIYPEGDYTALATLSVTPESVIRAVKSMDRRPSAVYLTSPDYMGNITDIKGISDALSEYGIPLLVDNAHGAYLRFLEPSRHPITLGAFMCCDSAHKTLPVLTGGAYLHLSSAAESLYGERVKSAMAIFASTSPSYLVLESLDLCNKYLSSGYKNRLLQTVEEIDRVKKYAIERGVKIQDSEPLKIVIDTSATGYRGDEIAELLRSELIEPEYSDPDYTVLMLTPENTARDMERLLSAIDRIFPRTPIPKEDLSALRVLDISTTVREALFAESELIPLDRRAVGRTVATPGVSCPPAIPIVSVGERISEDILPVLERYGIKEISVIKERQVK